MAIPLSYSVRNLATRRLTTALTAGGMAMVVFVFASIQMLAAGLRATLVDTGAPDNVVAIRKASQTEVQSALSREQAAVVAMQPEIATGADGARLAAAETMVLISLTQRRDGRPANVTIRGVGPASLALRPQARLVSGRMPRPGSLELVAGSGVSQRFAGAQPGESLRFAQREWRVVGVLDAGRTSFDSELWADGDQLMQAFRRTAHSSVIARLGDPAGFERLRARLEGDPRLALELKRETRFYADQSEAMATFLRVLGSVLAVVFSVGAVIGAMITMYSAVAGRVTEIGTLRALGFRRGEILLAFLLEAGALGLAGGVAGVLAASALQWVTVSTTNWQTFSELAFGFALTPAIAAQSLLFGVGMGIGGGMLPAVRAARLGIVDALRTS